MTRVCVGTRREKTLGGAGAGGASATCVWRRKHTWQKQCVRDLCVCFVCGGGGRLLSDLSKGTKKKEKRSVLGLFNDRSTRRSSTRETSISVVSRGSRVYCCTAPGGTPAGRLPTSYCLPQDCLIPAGASTAGAATSGASTAGASTAGASPAGASPAAASTAAASPGLPQAESARQRVLAGRRWMRGARERRDEVLNAAADDRPAMFSSRRRRERIIESKRGFDKNGRKKKGSEEHCLRRFLNR